MNQEADESDANNTNTNDNLIVFIFQEYLELMQMFTNENTEIGDGRRSFGIYFSDRENGNNT